MDSRWITVGVKPLNIKMTLTENRWVFKGTEFTKLAQQQTKPLRHTNSSGTSCEMGHSEGF